MERVSKILDITTEWVSWWNTIFLQTGSEHCILVVKKRYHYILPAVYLNLHRPVVVWIHSTHYAVTLNEPLGTEPFDSLETFPLTIYRNKQINTKIPVYLYVSEVKLTFLDVKERHHNVSACGSAFTGTRTPQCSLTASQREIGSASTWNTPPT